MCGNSEGSGKLAFAQSEPWLVAYVISTIISRAGSFLFASKEGKESLPASDITPPRELDFNLTASVLEDIEKAEKDADMWVLLSRLILVMSQPEIQQ